MASFYRSNVAEFLALSDEQVLAQLSVAYANRGFTRQYSDQTLTWERDLKSLRTCLQEYVQTVPLAPTWGLLLQFSIPRKELRIDAILLINREVVILEAKTGDAFLQARKQLEEYSLLLHYFHKASVESRIVPIIVSPESGETDFSVLNQTEMFPQLATFWVNKVIASSWDNLASALSIIAKRTGGQITVESWDESPYHPVPSIIEAAIALRSGLSIREIAHSEASEHEIGTVRQTIQSYVDQARTDSQHVICFLTGVPGSGKTLVGLSLAHSQKTRRTQSTL